MNKFNLIAVFILASWFFAGCGISNAQAENDNQNLSSAIQSETPTLTSAPTLTLPSETASPVTIDAFAGKMRFNDIEIREGDPALILPEEVAVFESSKPLKISGETGQSFEQNLVDNGWKEHEFEGSRIEGLYFIGSRELGEGFSNESAFEQAAEDFMKDSGLNSFLEERQLEASLKVSGDNGQYTALYTISADGNMTESYVRINLESDKICGECKIYILDYVNGVKLSSASLEEALPYAFAYSDSLSKESGYSYYVSDVKLEYVNGIPYYSFYAVCKEVAFDVYAYAPAIPMETILNDEALLQKFIDFE